MPIKILMPALSPTMTTGNLVKWLKEEGDKVVPGEIIAEIETDKATMEIEAVDEGMLGKIIIKAGSQNIAVHSLIALLFEDGEEVSELDSFMRTNTKHDQTLANDDADALACHNSNNINLPKEDEGVSTGSRIFASPLAKKIAAQNKISLEKIAGTGPYGRIVKADIDMALQSAAQNLQNNTNEDLRNNILYDAKQYRAVPNSNVRKIIAKRLLESKQTIPHFYLSIECNVDKLLLMRQELNNVLEDQTNKISVNDFIILAVAKALREVWEANASWHENEIHYYNNVDISVAVAVEAGIITPIIKSADQKSIINLSREAKALAKRAKENKLSPEEFNGGNFTISNLGMYGIKNFSAIINPPQSCILAVGEATKRAVILNDQIVIATIIDITLSCDHRVVDGTIGAKFLAVFRKLIENPILMFA